MFFFFQAIVMIGFLLGFQYAPSWKYMPVLLWALLDLIVLTSACAVFLSAVNVYFRDVQHLIGVVLQAWFWVAPIIYSYNLVYGLFKRHDLHVLTTLYLIDPVTPIILAFQRALYGKVTVRTPTNPHLVVLSNYPYHFYLEMLAILLVAGVVAFFGAMLVFARIEGNFAQEL